MEFFRKLDNNLIQCTACSRYCEISQGSVGFCGVRKNTCGDLELLSYGRFLFLKKQEKNLLVGSMGSNMRTTFDPNWDSSLFPVLSSQEVGREKTNERVKTVGYEYSPLELVEYAKKLGCEKIVFEFNEPLVYLEYILEVCKIDDIKVCIVTTGYFSKESLSETLLCVDEVHFLLFSSFEKFYMKHCKAQLKNIKDNIQEVFQSSVGMRILCPLVSEDLGGICKFLLQISSEIPLSFLKYSPSYKMLDKEITTDQEVQEAINFAKKQGLKNVSEKCIL